MIWGSESVECTLSSANGTASPFTGRFLRHCQAEKITVPFPVTVFRDDHQIAQPAACGSNTVSCTGYNTPYGPKSSLVKEPLKEAKDGGTGDVGCLNLDLQAS